MFRRSASAGKLPLRAAPFVVLVAGLLTAGVQPVHAGVPPAADPPFHCYLTWQGDPGSTVTVNFHTTLPHAFPQVRFDTESHGGDAAAYRFAVPASTHVIPGLDAIPGAGRFIHVAELTGLSPGAVYYFVPGSSDGGYTGERSVCLPSTDLDGLRFVAGGDVGTDAAVVPLLQAAAAESPRFAIIGGDVAYADGNLANWAAWDLWLHNWETNMVTPDGFTVPLIVAIGNHEVAGGFGAFDDPLTRAPFYFGLFAQSGRGFDEPRSAYFRRDFGPELSLLVLDSGHVTPIVGVQSDWIANQLSGASNVDLRLAAYHVPMYPSHRAFDGAPSPALREAWLALFDAWGLDVAFENHDHMLKRTFPLRANRPEAEGTVYLGDGCFGQAPRTGAQAVALEDPDVLDALGLEANYLAAWAAERHFWMAEIVRAPASQRFTAVFRALDENGEVLDEMLLDLELRDSGSNPNCVFAVLFGVNSGGTTGVLPRLRAFRDDWLLRFKVAAPVAEIYYRLSPHAARWLRGHPAASDRLVIFALITAIASSMCAASAPLWKARRGSSRVMTSVQIRRCA